jgi:hypothetical protein
MQPDEKQNEDKPVLKNADKTDDVLVDIQREYKVVESKLERARTEWKMAKKFVPNLFSTGFTIISVVVLTQKYFNYIPKMKAAREVCPETNLNDFCGKSVLPPDYNSTSSCDTDVMFSFCRANIENQHGDHWLIASGIIIFLCLLVSIYLKYGIKRDRNYLPGFVDSLNNDEKHQLQQTLVDARELSASLDLETRFPDAISTGQLGVVSMELERVSLAIPAAVQQRKEEANMMGKAIAEFGIFATEKTSLQKDITKIISEYLVPVRKNAVVK